MKKIILLALLAVSGATAMAQSTRKVKGTVTDKSGNPIPGVRVESKGSTETVVTDVDGSFTIKVLDTDKKVVARYAGLKPSVKTAADGMVIVMTPGSSNKGISDGERTCNWFVSAQGALSLGDIYSISKGSKDMSGKVGLMVGVLGKVGAYGKVMFCPDDDTDCEVFNSVSLGINAQICKGLYGYLGVGGGQVFGCWKSSTAVNHYGTLFEVGVIGKFGRHFMLNAGYTINTDFDCKSHDINLGIGYVF